MIEPKIVPALGIKRNQIRGGGGRTDATAAKLTTHTSTAFKTRLFGVIICLARPHVQFQVTSVSIVLGETSVI